MSSKSESELSHVVKFALLELIAVVIGLIFVRKEVYMAGKFGEMVLHWQEYAMLLLVLIDGLVRGRARSLYSSPFRKKVLRYLLPFALFLYVACSSLCDKLNVACIHEEWFRSLGLFVLGAGVCFLVWTQRTRPVALLLYFQKSSHESWLDRDFADEDTEPDLKKTLEADEKSAPANSLSDSSKSKIVEESSSKDGSSESKTAEESSSKGENSESKTVEESSSKDESSESKTAEESSSKGENSESKTASSKSESSENRAVEKASPLSETFTDKTAAEASSIGETYKNKIAGDESSVDEGSENKSPEIQDADYKGDSYATKEISRAREADKTPSRKEAWKKEQAESNIEENVDKPVFVYEELRGPWRFLRYPGRTAILLELIGISITLSTWLPLITLPGLIVLFKWELADVEAFRTSQFGSAYVDYKEKSWLLIPYVY